MRKDGSKSYVELNAGIVTYEGKNADLVIVRDINERKNATQAIRESEEKYRSLVTTTGDVIWETDDKARFIFVSPQVESIIGFKPDEPNRAYALLNSSNRMLLNRTERCSGGSSRIRKSPSFIYRNGFTRTDTAYILKVMRFQSIAVINLIRFYRD